MNTVLTRTGLPPSHTPPVLTSPSPLTWRGLVVGFPRYPSPQRASSYRIRLRLPCADSPRAPGRIEFVILRTGQSPPGAPHLASRRRSSCWLRAGERVPGEDSHLPVGVRLEAHAGLPSGAGRHMLASDASEPRSRAKRREPCAASGASRRPAHERSDVSPVWRPAHERSDVSPVWRPAHERSDVSPAPRAERVGALLAPSARALHTVLILTKFELS
jgi:hypothetical protein